MERICKIFLISCLLGMVLLTAGCGSDSDSHHPPAGPNDSVALVGETTGKLFFDINMSDETKLPLYFDVISQTYEGLENQGVAPDFVVAFRGMAVTHITDGADSSFKTLISDMAALPNVRLEACSVATGLFGVDNATVLPEIEVVGNTFISSIGFQAGGYAPILIQ